MVAVAAANGVSSLSAASVAAGEVDRNNDEGQIVSRHKKQVSSKRANRIFYKRKFVGCENAVSL